MVEKGLNKFFWGFIFIMLGFRIQGFDIFPDIIGYILFAVGFKDLNSSSDYFKVASKYNIVMIVVSIFSIYEMPTHTEGIHFGSLGILSFIVGIASLVISLLVVYNLFMGIHEIAHRQERYELAEDSLKKWKQFLILQIAVWVVLLLIFIPILAIILVFAFFIASIIITISILSFLKRCSRELSELS
ncbi:hypothetical protein [Clostridium sp. 'White wine YQ']|uniref:hypothetical protein n=1 Tax=Clostridium sp. 'White wine YQ' TaxID=3027474 RepID=UPI0023662831|nr:hypothetical protein [Clostridium sp. 'White wine YQ']MDD7793441.1 hypothetical protein [Clostridium sp. 'White wine YQ']